MSLEYWKKSRKARRAKKLFEEIIAENFTNLLRDINLHIQEFK